MRILVDTHTILWYAFGNTRMTTLARGLIDDQANLKFLSIATPWEVGIKVSSGKLTVTKPVDVFFSDAHVALVSTLPFHHRDPFDRLLIAQSLVGGISIVSADAQLDAYGVTRLW